jgi:hypothetical protein
MGKLDNAVFGSPRVAIARTDPEAKFFIEMPRGIKVMDRQYQMINPAWLHPR